MNCTFCTLIPNNIARQILCGPLTGPIVIGKNIYLFQLNQIRGQRDKTFKSHGQIEIKINRKLNSVVNRKFGKIKQVNTVNYWTRVIFSDESNFEVLNLLTCNKKIIQSPDLDLTCDFYTTLINIQGKLQIYCSTPSRSLVVDGMIYQRVKYNFRQEKRLKMISLNYHENNGEPPNWFMTSSTLNSCTVSEAKFRLY
ncbi:hypothetical protein BpHYR1_043692 [Brachionus plicatilis]|uniref:Uncharacterized protein n=1 Tax=Brachionus plicatilis TaxID=10195 RepID=A0A3M7RMU5_BRAPC|nr:hypothetical protein BpHYR1_043692 [Brachionus plicatilis]